MPRDPTSVMKTLGLTADAHSRHYVRTKTQYQLHSLLTERSHPATRNLSWIAKRDARDGLESILTADADVTAAFRRLARSPDAVEEAVSAVLRALREGHRIFIYGCGSTGRLAKQMESALWKPFWRGIKAAGFPPPLDAPSLGEIQSALTGEMTGGDRALVSALEGFEDLSLVGELQVEDHGVAREDVVFCITEGGETSSVIGALQAALSLAGRRRAGAGPRRCFFIYNNPDALLLPFRRSRRVIENSEAARINLTTGAQAVTGSTRMQAATSETWITGWILERAARAFLVERAGEEAAAALGFAPVGRENPAEEFEDVRLRLTGGLGDAARFAELESAVYRAGGRAVYFAVRALIPVFIDCAERSPTFHLHPLDPTTANPPLSWLRVWTAAGDPEEAWRVLLGRDYRGLNPELYAPHFRSRIRDRRLRDAALSSLEKAGSDQAGFYDFSMSARNLAGAALHSGDLAVVAALDGEIDALADDASPFSRFLDFVRSRGAAAALILIGEPESPRSWRLPRTVSGAGGRDVVIRLPYPRAGDPLGFRRQTLIKMLLNAHSTVVMARLGRVVGNAMTHVQPGNLKLVGRATSLILDFVNDTLADRDWIIEYGERPPLSYAEANAVLFRALQWTGGAGGSRSEVELSVIRILETFRRGRAVGWEECAATADRPGLEEYLSRLRPSLLRAPSPPPEEKTA